MGDDYGYFGSGSSGYAHYQQTFKSCFGGSSGSDGGHHNNEPDWSNLLTLLKIGVLIVVPLYWTVTALHIAFYDLASIEPNGYMENVTELTKPPFDKPISFMRLFDVKARTALVGTINRVRDNAVRIEAS